MRITKNTPATNYHDGAVALNKVHWHYDKTIPCTVYLCKRWNLLYYVYICNRLVQFQHVLSYSLLCNTCGRLKLNHMMRINVYKSLSESNWSDTSNTKDRVWLLRFSCCVDWIDVLLPLHVLLRGSEWGVHMSVVGYNFITLSVKIFDLCRLSVNLS